MIRKAVLINSKLKLPSALALATSIMMSFGAVAQTADSNEVQSTRSSIILEEVIVTAQRRRQSAQDVGVAITAFTGEQLEKLGLESSIDIINYTPGVSLAGDIGGQRALFNIRGVVQNDFADIAEAPVAVYVDDGYLASTQAQTFGLYDIDRVEVLKGPQGTLFGRNATGGLVHSITNRPSEETSGYTELTVGNFSNTRFEGAIGGKLSEGVNGRVSALYSNWGEILDNQYTGVDAQGRSGTPGGGQDGYNDDTVAVRAQLDFVIGDKGNLLFIGNYADTTKSEGPYQGIGVIPVFDGQGRHINTIRAPESASNCEAISSVTGGCINLFADGDTDGVRPAVGGDLFGNFDPDGPDDGVNKDFAFTDENIIESEGFAAHFNWKFESGVDFASITDYKSFFRSITLDSDQSATPLALFQSDGDIDQFSQEFRFSGNSESLKWVAGLFYLNVESDAITGLAYNANSPFLVGFPQQVLGLDGVVFGPEEDNTLGALKTDSYSIFGQFDFALSDTLVLVAGIRGTQEEKEYSQRTTAFANNNDRIIETDTVLFQARDPFDDERSDFLVSGKLQLEYSPSDNRLYYVGFNRGVKAGSYNIKLFDGVTLADDQIPYDEEILHAYEGGMKLTFAGGSARLNGSVFYYDYQDHQAFTWSRNSGFVTNNDAEYYGAELELAVNPADGWDIITSVAYIDAQVNDVEIAPGIFRDVEPSFTPEFQAAATLRYGFEALSGLITAQLSGSYQSSTFHNLRNFDAHEISSWSEFNARLSWDSIDSRWGVALNVNNLFDDDHGVIGFDVASFGGYQQESFARPRWTTLSLNYSF